MPNNYIATITLQYEPELYAAILPEIVNNNWGRSSYTIKKKGKKIIITIIADDATALRASFNNITKLLAVYDKIKIP